MQNPQPTFSSSVLIRALFFVVVIPLLPILISWHWNWWEAWAYSAVFILSFVVSRTLAARRHPDLLTERSRFFKHADAKPWDQVLARIMGLGGGSIMVVAGLDARFGWSSSYFGLPVKIVTLGAILAGTAVSSYALLENRFFSGMVRIQTERGHHVVSSGPYRWVRHPGYAGALLAYLASPFFLDSLWALVPVTLLTTALVVRTQLEDQTLQNELDGYRDYAQRVRYRLLPGLW